MPNTMSDHIEIEREAWERACRLVETLGKNIGRIAPGSHTTLYSDLNQHYLLAEKIEREAKADAE